MTQNDQDGKRHLKHVKGDSPIHLFELDIVGPHSSWKEKVYKFIFYKFQFTPIPSIFIAHDTFSVFVHPGSDEGYREADINNIETWDLMFYIKNVSKKKEYSNLYYDEDEKEVFFELGSGSLEEINELLNRIGLILPDIV